MKDSVVKRAKVVWHCVKSYIGTYYLAFSFGGVFWMLLDVYATKSIDASFISACADVTLVAFALIAGIEAKKAWEKRVKEDGYKIATGLMNDKLIKTITDHDLIQWNFKMKLLLPNYINLDDTLKFNNEEVRMRRELYYINRMISLHGDLKGFYKDSIYNLSQEIQFDIFRMRNVGVNFSETDEGEKLRGYFEEFMALSIECEKLVMAMGFFIGCYLDKEGRVAVDGDYLEYRFHLKTISLHQKLVSEMTNSLRVCFNDITKDSQQKNLLSYFNIS